MGKLQADSLDVLFNRRSAKWRGFEKDVLPLPVAEMDFPVAEPIRNVMLDMVNRSDFGYGGIAPEYAKAFAEFSERRWGWTPDQSQVRLATDVGVAGVEVLRVFTEPGDKVLVNSPVYHNFYTWIKEAKCVIEDSPLRLSEDGEWNLDFTELEEKFASGVKAYILCSPHNPVGKVFSRDDLVRIADLSAKYNVLVISDEIHAPLTFAEATFIPYLTVSENARTHGLCITSASKSWNIAGLKCAHVVTENDDLNTRLNELPISMGWRPSILGAWASIAAYADGDAWLDDLMETLDENRKLVAALLEEHLPQAQYSIPASTYLAWIDLSAYGLENPAKAILDKARVAFNAGGDFGPSGDQYVRLNFATSPEILTEAIKRIADVLEA